MSVGPRHNRGSTFSGNGQASGAEEFKRTPHVFRTSIRREQAGCGRGVSGKGNSHGTAKVAAVRYRANRNLCALSRRAVALDCQEREISVLIVAREGHCPGEAALTVGN